jgi:hypothetical protein
MPEDVEIEAGEDATPDHFPETPKDLSHVTLYFDTTPTDGEDDSFFFVKIETPDAVDDDFDNWYEAALEAILVQNPDLADAKFAGAALKYGREEVYFRLDGDAMDEDSPPTGELVQGRSYKNYDGGVSYDYGDLFA